jgi:hypothetical protein
MIAHTRLICVDLFVPEEAKDPDTGSVMNELPEEAEDPDTGFDLNELPKEAENPAQIEEQATQSEAENRDSDQNKRPRNKVSSYIPREKMLWIQYVFCGDLFRSK